MPPFPTRLTCRRTLFVATACCAALGPAAGSRAVEPAVEFLRAAQDNGYGEVAIDYLEQLRAAGRMPQELAETYDLELSRSYRVAVSEAFNPAEAETRMAKAQTHLDKFLEEHADHPQVARAMESWGDIGLARGLERLRQAAGTNDKTQKEKFRAAARADFAEARPRFVDATARYLDRYGELKAALASGRNPRARSTATMTRKQRELQETVRDAEFAWLECRFKSAKIDFYTGQSYANPKATQRTGALKAAAKAFDDVFQSYRESIVGLHAHLWHGRSVDEMGQDQLALDIYDEVLAIAPDTRERDTGLEPLFAQAQYYRLLALRRNDGVGTFLAEADAWLEFRRAWQRFDGYQGVKLELAKTKLQRAGELSGRQKTTLLQSALAALADVAKVRGEHQQEAIMLRRRYTAAGAAAVPAKVKTFVEAQALGEAAIDNLDWSGAVAMFVRALELTSGVDQQRISQAETRLDQARYQLAVAHYSAGKYDQCRQAAQQIIEDRPEGQMAPPAASLAVSAALTLYARAKDKQAAFEQLDGIARDMIRRWPDKPQADDARIALGQASLVRREYAAAAAAFEKVNPRSARYAVAMFLAGQTNWRLYLIAKSKAGSTAELEALVPQRAKAGQQLQTSLDLQREAAKANPSLAEQLTDTQLLLAELKLQAGQSSDAAQLVGPLAEAIANDKPNPLDNTHLRVLLTAARAQAALGQFDQVAASARLLAELGQDNATVNGVLNTMFKLLVDAWKQAEADAIEARTAGDSAARATAEKAAAKRKKLLAERLPPLALRAQNSLAAKIYIADTASQLGENDTARNLYQSILAQAENDPAFEQASKAALTRIRSQLVGLLRQKEQFSEALGEVDTLIEQFPNALEPLMEKGRVLQDWADVEPDRFDDAVAHWTMLRTRLARIPRKPPEYYEIVYNAASCLFTDSLKSSDPQYRQQKALQAEQLLNATLVLSPRMSGPEMVARYKELLQKARQLQESPTANR